MLAALRSTQRRGVLTAMLGQGYGPLANPPLTELAGTVIPQLNLISLRAPRVQRTVAGLRGGRGEPVVTGDDALELAGAGRLAAGPALGVNLLASAYTGLESGGSGGRTRRPRRAASEARLVASRRRGLAGAEARSAQTRGGGTGLVRDITRWPQPWPTAGSWSPARITRQFSPWPGESGWYFLHALLRGQIRRLAGTLRSAGHVRAGGEPGGLAGPDAEPRACGHRAGR